MSVIFPILLLLIFAACVGFLYTEGMWGNALRLINVVTAALLATNFFEPLAKLLENSVYQRMSYLWDFLSIWGLFVVSLVLLRTLTGYVSRVKVRFLKIADRIGGIAFAVVIGFVMVCFVTMTLHAAPLGVEFVWGGFTPNPEKKMMWGLAPDHKWLKFTELLSKGAYCRSASEEDVAKNRYFNASWAGSDASERERGLCVFYGVRYLGVYLLRRAALQTKLESGQGGVGALLVDGAPRR